MGRLGGLLSSVNEDYVVVLHVWYDRYYLRILMENQKRVPLDGNLLMFMGLPKRITRRLSSYSLAQVCHDCRDPIFLGVTLILLEIVSKIF